MDPTPSRNCIEIIVRHRAEQFVPWNDGKGISPPDPALERPVKPGNLYDRDRGESRRQYQKNRQLIVSLQHLSKASGWFHAWDRILPSGPAHDSHCVVDVIDVDAFTIVINHIHGRTELFPRHVNLETLAKVAVLVIYLGCSEVLGNSPQRWMDKLWREQHWAYSRDIVLWIYVAQMFKDPQKFREATRQAMMLWPGRFIDLGLHIEASVSAEINIRREKTLALILSRLRTFTTNHLQRVRTMPSIDNEVALFGTLLKQLHHKYSMSPEGTCECSIAKVVKDIAALRQSFRLNPSQANDPPPEKRVCSEIELVVTAFIRDTTVQVEDLEGLELPEGYQPQEEEEYFGEHDDEDEDEDDEDQWSASNSN
ncbi:hypothetical protein F5Y12DRAFT_714005 [Xylaria sp. FL1777]|nr:hypothetical protein F5Y12DRAFT_714005 [Xylaria sp. FL1777]